MDIIFKNNTLALFDCLHGNQFMIRYCFYHALDQALLFALPRRLRFRSRGWSNLVEVRLDELQNFGYTFHIHEIVYIMHRHKLRKCLNNFMRSFSKLRLFRKYIKHFVVVSQICKKQNATVNKILMKIKYWGDMLRLCWFSYRKRYGSSLK